MDTEKLAITVAYILTIDRDSPVYQSVFGAKYLPSRVFLMPLNYTFYPPLQ